MARSKSRTYAPFDHMAVQTTLDRCGVVLMDRSQVRTAPGPQPQRGPLHVTDCGSGSPVARGGQSRATGDPKLRLAHWNAEGVRQKKTELQNFLKQNGIDVCTIQETHLTQNHRFYVRGYETYRQDRESRSKGGVVTLVRNTIPSIEIQRSRASDTEFLVVELILPDHHLQVFNIYSPPDKSIALHLIQPTTENWIIMGDFNSHSPSWGYDELDSKGEEVECWATNQQLILINKPQDPPTFYSRSWRTTSTPDLAFATDNIHKLCHREVCSQLGGSDHRPVTILVDQKTPASTFKRAPSWNYKRADWDGFKQFAEEECMGLQLSEENMNHNAVQLNNAILRAAKKSIPRGQRRNYNPFWTPQLEQLQEAVNRAREDMERNPSDQNTAEYKKARAEFTREKLLQTRKQWYEKTASLNLEKDSSKLWSLTKVLNEEAPSRSKTVLHVHNMLLTDKKAANEFAQLYRRESTLPLTTKKVGDMKEKLKQEEKQKNDPSPCLNSTLKISELNSAIRSLKPKKAPGPDGVSNDMLKHLGPIARKMLLEIFNRSWNKGLVPEVWKTAHLVPVLKKGKDKTDPSSYRPISLLSCVGKLMERVITRRLTWFLETNNVFSPSQTGYRQHRNTEDQLALLTQDIENSFQEKRKLLAVFFDLSKAFDRVWKKGLQWRLLRAGVSGQMYKWISSFLYHRVARVKLDGSLSRKIRLCEGVPQGSVLSPTLFLLYVNDIVNTLPPRVTNSLHADDLAAWTSAEHTSTATHVMQETINRVSSWADEWCMEINCSKTQATLFSLSTVKEKVMLKLEDMPVPQVDNPTFLGVTLDTRLTWKTHLEAVAARSVRKLGLLKKLAGTTWGADTNILRRVYTGAVRPIMEYATTSWATASNTNKNKLDKVQNVALRAIVGAMKTTPIKEMEKRADLEPLELRRTFKVLTQTEKIRRLPGHPLHKKLAAPTKNRLKRQSLNHLARDLRRTHEDILDPQINEGNNLCSRDWNQDDLRATIFLEVPGLLPAEQQIPAQQMALTLEMLEEKYPQAGWTHIYTDGSAEEAVRNGGSGVFVRTPTGQTFGYSNATGRKCSNFKAETSALQNAVAYIAEMKPQKTVILTDSKAALQSLTSNTPDQPIHQLLKDLQLLPHECTVVLQWIPAHCGIPGNERADRLAKTGSKQLQPTSTSTYQEAKTLLRNRQKCQWKKATGDYNPSTDPINRLARHEQTTIFRLRTGHCGLRAHLKRIGIMDSALCDCKEAEQTVHHILQDCPIWRKQRHQLWPQGEPTTNKLWGTAEDLRRTTQFMTTCGLRV